MKHLILRVTEDSKDLKSDMDIEGFNYMEALAILEYEREKIKQNYYKILNDEENK